MTPIVCQGSGYPYKFSREKLSVVPYSATEQEMAHSSLSSTSPEESRDLPDGLVSEYACSDDGGRGESISEWWPSCLRWEGKTSSSDNCQQNLDGAGLVLQSIFG